VAAIGRPTTADVVKVCSTPARVCATVQPRGVPTGRRWTILNNDPQSTGVLNQFTNGSADRRAAGISFVNRATSAAGRLFGHQQAAIAFAIAPAAHLCYICSLVL
jgi:hypothetical protein